jgi:cell division protein FtsB
MKTILLNALFLFGLCLSSCSLSYTSTKPQAPLKSEQRIEMFEEDIYLLKTEHETLQARIKKLEEDVYLLKNGHNSNKISTSPSHDIEKKQ